MDRQLVLVGAASDSNVVAWDLQTGTQLTSYKGNACPRNALCCIGQDYFVAAQSSKDSLQCWTWSKEHVLHRFFTPEKISCVAASADGMHLVGGGVSGHVCLWEVASGRLLRVWPAHYKAVTVLAFQDDASVLVSGGEDTLVAVWALADLLDEDAAAAHPQPIHTWLDHTLPVTGLCLGGGGSSALVVTCSLDHTCRVYRCGDGRLLRRIALPSALHCVLLDPGEHALWCGGADGSIFEVSLVGDTRPQQQQPRAGAGAGGSAAAAAAAAGLVLASHSNSNEYIRLPAHSRAVSSLAQSRDGALLVSGSEDGGVAVWDLRSRQQVRQLMAPGKAPVSCVKVVPHPQHLVQGGDKAVASGLGPPGSQGPKRALPLAASLAKYPGLQLSVKPWDCPPVLLDQPCTTPPLSQLSELCPAAAPPTHLNRATDVSLPGLHTRLATFAAATGVDDTVACTQEHVLVDGSDMAASTGCGSIDEVDVLHSQLAKAQAEVQHWRVLHQELAAACVREATEQLHAGAGVW